MKKIDLSISDRAYTALKNELGPKKMSGNLYGICDGVCLKIIQAIEDESPDTTIFMKDDDPETP